MAVGNQRKNKAIGTRSPQKLPSPLSSSCHSVLYKPASDPRKVANGFKTESRLIELAISQVKDWQGENFLLDQEQAIEHPPRHVERLCRRRQHVNQDMLSFLSFCDMFQGCGACGDMLSPQPHESLGEALCRFSPVYPGAQTDNRIEGGLMTHKS